MEHIFMSAFLIPFVVSMTFNRIQFIVLHLCNKFRTLRERKCQKLFESIITHERRRP